MELPEAVERVLQQFEAMAGAADWSLDESGGMAVRAPGYLACPLMWMAGGQFGAKPGTFDSCSALGLTIIQGAHIYDCADNNHESEWFSAAVRARLLAAAGLA